MTTYSPSDRLCCAVSDPCPRHIPVGDLVDITITRAKVLGRGENEHGPYLRIALSTPAGEAAGRIHYELGVVTVERHGGDT